MTGKLSKNFHGAGIGPLSNILAVKKSLTKPRKLDCMIQHVTMTNSIFDLVNLFIMALPVVEFSREGYKIRKVFD